MTICTSRSRPYLTIYPPRRNYNEQLVCDAPRQRRGENTFAVTVALSYVNFGTQKANVAVAMLVATFKAGLVAAIFMHLSAEKRLIYRVLIFTGFFVFGLFWLTYLAWYDPIHR